MSMIINGPKGGTFGSTGIQKTVDENGNTTYYRGRGGETANGTQFGREAVLVDMGSDGTIDGGGRHAGVMNSDGDFAYRAAVRTPDATSVVGAVVNGENKTTWERYR